jgi:hypothetical protein
MSKRVCVFCGGSPLTLEDAWPVWLANLVFPPGFVVRKSRGAPANMHAFNTTDIYVRVRQVCAACNNGWMSDLETGMENLLTPWLRGLPTALGLEEQQRIATWTVKTAMMLQFTRTGIRPIPPAHFTQLYARKTRPPDHSYVFIGIEPDTVYLPRAWLHMGTRPIEQMDLRGLAPKSTLHFAYEATIIVQHLVLTVLGYEGPELQLGRHLTLGRHLFRIWPPVSSRGILLPSRN